MNKRFAVASVVDDDQVLEALLNQIAAQGGRLRQVIWQPAPVSIGGESPSDTMLQQGGFVVISEHGGLASIAEL